MISTFESQALKINKTIIYTGIVLIGCGFFVWYGIANANQYWHVILSSGILYLLISELQLLGWTHKKQGAFVKIPISLALVSNIFLAFIIMFKVPILALKPYIIASIIASLAVLVYGVYFHKQKIN